MKQFSREIHFFKKFKMIHDKIVCLDKSFERRFNFWYFYESFSWTKIVEFQILSKDIEFEILFSEMLTLTHFLLATLFRSTLTITGDQSFYG